MDIDVGFSKAIQYRYDILTDKLDTESSAVWQDSVSTYNQSVNIHTKSVSQKYDIKRVH